jgi:glycosyltransferase involved in cell wall biosynthesis
MPGLTRKVSLVKNGLGPIHLLDRTTARNKLIKLPPKTMWIGGIGELHPNKNWSTAILAMKQLPTEAHLLIIGEGEERTHLTELINQESLSDRVHLLGYLDGATYLNAFDIFILPSLKEGLPYALIEAGQAGLPVVASDLPGNHDIITTGETGFLIEPTPQLISTTLTMLLRDEGMRGQLGRTLQQVVQQEFSIARMLQETLQVYECNKSADWYSTGA